MAIILNIETATTNCSVGISKNGTLVALKEDNTPNYSHAEQLHSFIQTVVEEAALRLTDIEAIAISKGPGSYTGLRIGVSAAKGLCFSLGIPLIAVPTLKVMAHQHKLQEGERIISLLDARRMEVYSAIFDHHYNEIRETKAEIVEEDSFKEYVGENKVYLLGNGAEKCKTVLTAPNFEYDNSIMPSAKQMSLLSEQRFQAGTFEDVAYFEPYYLKDFIVAKPSKTKVTTKK
ncbi:tRNA (adenosine(37)-N6)-threonylcarbamoyltransferase complex dimerization subunit type 1 TsaB [Spongiimicrobium salis]|uniref:tRNA (adenosine(37)-N6)-threonylcarbamoyltransferase complex dimerization subunit type 1 TsaB n=1 Tax=Spongiimicrobium salis TaxID=1667022 RepID=UPI00374D50E6